MNTNDMENTISHYSNKWSLDMATICDAADDERAFLKPFLAERRKDVAWIFLQPFVLRGKLTSESLMTFLRLKYEYEPGVSTSNDCGITEEDQAFNDQVYLAICKDPLAQAYADYIVEYATQILLPEILATNIHLHRELPVTQSQEKELRALGVRNVLDYDRRTATSFIAQHKAAHAREKTERELKRLVAQKRQVGAKNS